MALQWRELPIWVTRDLARYYAPSDFKKKFPETRVIVDGTECPVKKPKLPTAQQSTFSTYKNRNTAKVLVGITPGGMCSYVSPAYGGSTSDRQIVERSSLPDVCDPGDSVMSDKGQSRSDQQMLLAQPPAIVLKMLWVMRHVWPHIQGSKLTLVRQPEASGISAGLPVCPGLVVVLQASGNSSPSQGRHSLGGSS